MATTTRRMSLSVVPAAVAIVSVGLTVWAQEKEPQPKAPTKVTDDDAAPAATAPAAKPVPSATAKPAAPTPTPTATAKPAEPPKPVVAAQPAAPATAAPAPVAPAVKPDPQAVKLAQQIRAAKGSFRAVDAARLKNAKAALDAAAKDLDAWLSADGDNGAAWKTFLLWDQLQTELKKKSDFDTASLAQVERRLTAGFDGLDAVDFRRTTVALNEFIAAAETAQTKDAQKDFEQTLETLAATVEKIGAAGPDAAQAAALGKLTARLASFQQAESVVEAVTGDYSHYNLLVDVSQSFADESLVEPIDQTAPVVDCILGTAIRGTGRTVGTVTLDFRPSAVDDRAEITAVMQGVNDSKTVGHNRSALIYSRGTTTLEGQQTLYLSEAGLAAGPVRGDASVKNKITGFGSTKKGIMGKIVTKVAAKKAPKQQAQATAIAAQHARTRLVRQLTDQVRDLVTKSQDGVATRLRGPLRRFNAEPQAVQITSSADDLKIRVLQTAPGRLGAVGAPPKIAGNAGLGVRLHRSLIENGAQQALAGRTFDRDRIDDLLRNQMGLDLKERNKLDETEFSITFAEQDPVSVVFEEGKFSVTIRSQGFTSEDKKIEAMDVTVHYVMKADDAGLKLTREGDFEIYPPGFRRGVDKLSFQQTSLRTVLKKNFEKAFPAEFIGEGVQLGEGRGTLFIAAAAADDGWLSLGFKKRAEPASAE